MDDVNEILKPATTEQTLKPATEGLITKLRRALSFNRQPQAPETPQLPTEESLNTQIRASEDRINMMSNMEPTPQDRPLIAQEKEKLQALRASLSAIKPEAQPSAGLEGTPQQIPVQQPEAPVAEAEPEEPQVA